MTAFSEAPRELIASPVTAALDIVRSNWIAGFLFYATIALVPLPFGSTDPAVIAFWCFALAITLLTCSLYRLRTPHLVIISGIALIIVGYLFVLHEQLSSHPWLAVSQPLWSEASRALGIPLKSSASVARNAPYFALGVPFTSIMSLACGVILGANRERARQLLHVIAWSGAIYAAFAIISYSIDPTMVLWRIKEQHQNDLTGPFTNRNTAAVYFGVCSIVWLLLLCAKIRHNMRHRRIYWKTLLAHVLSEKPLAYLLAFFMLFLCLMAMFMTKSRSGVMLALLSFALAFTGFFYRDFSRRKGIFSLVGVGTAFVSVLLLLMGSGVDERFGAIGFDTEGRFDVYRSAIRLIADHPWFGTGLGTFVWSFPAYRSNNISVGGVLDHAHNMLLELAAEMGVPFAALISLAWIIALIVLASGIFNRRRDNVLPTAAFAVACLALLHSFVEFSLQTPGCAIVVFALVGAGMSQSFRATTRGLSTADLPRAELYVTSLEEPTGSLQKYSGIA